VAGDFSNYAVNFAFGANTEQQALSLHELDLAIDATHEVAQQHPTNLDLWQNLASQYITRKLLFGVAIPSAGESAADTAVALSPRGYDSQLVRAQMSWVEGRDRDAEPILRAIENDYPPQPPVEYTLARILIDEGDIMGGLAKFEHAMSVGYSPTGYRDIKPFADAYGRLHDYAKEVELLVYTVHIHFTLDLAIALANAYQAAGLHDQAVALYVQIVRGYPGTASQMPAIIP
jgi:hypothetical protein